MSSSPDLHVERVGMVAVVEMRRPPHNFFDHDFIARLADRLEALDAEDEVRAFVLAAEGAAFCAGADLAKADPTGSSEVEAGRKLQPHLYNEANRLFRLRKPLIAAVHGAAVGGGLGLALAADFRVTCPGARFWANFSRLGFHAGFGITATLPRLIGDQKAALLLYTGRKVGGEEAVALGLADVLAADGEVRQRAIALAQEIAEASPLAVMSMRRTLRRGLTEAVEVATERELTEQTWQRETQDFDEGVRAMSERRPPVFVGG